MIKLFSPSDRKRYSWELSEGIYTIGRHQELDLVIEDMSISRRHAQIEILEPETIILTDLGSHNGTTVNGYRISKPTSVKPGDIITLGRVDLKLTRTEPAKTRAGSVNVTDREEDLMNARILPIEEALQPLPAEVTYDPKVFRAFSEMGKMLVLPGPEEEMLGKGLELLREIIPVERAAIFLTAGLEDELSLSACCVAGEGSSGSFTISRTILNELLRQQNAILISDAQADTKFAEQKSIVESKIRSAMAVPLYDEGKVFGVLYADTTNPVHRFTEDYLRITATFGNILAAKMINCTLLKERQAKEILESELAAASQIQAGLLPREFPDIDGYSLSAFQIQSKQVGGDLYDVFRLPDGGILFLLADVSGKGMGAALLASNILASFRVLYSVEELDLLEVTRRVSQQLLRSTRPEDFATLFVGLLGPETNTLRYLNAGHNPPMLVRHNGGVEYLEASGIPIGAFDLAGWREGALELGVGDFLFVFTDGVPEAMDGQQEEFGEQRLRRAVLGCRHQPPEELIESVMKEVKEFIGDTPPSDDTTVLVLRRER
jgi:sigma-B regulation protein RsbU (phosphoserine phosphatase)